MKYLAILKDSLREAVDSKVFYVMLGLSVVVALAAATLSYEPLPAGKRVMDALVPGLDIPKEKQDLRWYKRSLGQYPFMGQQMQPTFSVEKVDPVEDSSDAPSSEFRIIIRKRFSDPQMQEKAKPEEIIAHIKEQFGAVGPLQIIAVKSVRALPTVPNEPGLRFEVITSPTKATLVNWPHECRIFFGALPFPGRMGLGGALFIVENYIVNRTGGWIIIIISIVITSFFVPNMMRKGTIDLLLVKPIQRWQLLTYKYIGGLTFIFCNTVVLVIGTWLALGLRSGHWSSGFLVSIFTLTFFFAILYSASVLFSVLTRSPIATILLTCGLWFFLFLVNLIYQIQRDENIVDGAFPATIKVLHDFLPRTADLSLLTDRILQRDLFAANQVPGSSFDNVPITWGESLSVSVVFVMAMLGLASWRFSVKDY